MFSSLKLSLALSSVAAASAGASGEPTPQPFLRRLRLTESRLVREEKEQLAVLRELYRDPACAKLKDAEALACFKRHIAASLPEQLALFEAHASEARDIQKRFDLSAGFVVSALGLLKPLYEIGEALKSPVEMLVEWGKQGFASEAAPAHEDMMDALKRVGKAVAFGAIEIGVSAVGMHDAKAASAAKAADAAAAAKAAADAAAAAAAAAAKPKVPLMPNFLTNTPWEKPIIVSPGN